MTSRGVGTNKETSNAAGEWQTQRNRFIVSRIKSHTCFRFLFHCISICRFANFDPEEA